MRASVAFLVVAVLAAVPLGQSQVQQKTGASQKTAQQKEISSLTARVEELTKSLQNLEAMTVELQTRLAELEQRQAATSVLKISRPDQLNRLKSELASSGCEADFNRAHAIALAHGTQGYTLEGAAAMECTERLRKIVERVVQTLEGQE